MSPAVIAATVSVDRDTFSTLSVVEDQTPYSNTDKCQSQDRQVRRPCNWFVKLVMPLCLYRLYVRCSGFSVLFILGGVLSADCQVAVCLSI
jgi:hypothetical protein